ncbi:hypothetical protein [Sorangium sp. So ce1024]|uniref:hypothetical protein n=1 Tax=Sorangium sp. So ce1024 TaxID=3133327 RepID=UPI003F10D6C8
MSTSASGTTAGGEISCTTDADCPVLPCGPCTPGTPITKELVAGPACAANPCRNASSTCDARRRCIVGPGTEKNPAVWGSAAP